jgi:hypothetical protein
MVMSRDGAILLLGVEEGPKDSQGTRMKSAGQYSWSLVLRILRAR